MNNQHYAELTYELQSTTIYRPYRFYHINETIVVLNFKIIYIYY